MKTFINKWSIAEEIAGMLECIYGVRLIILGVSNLRKKLSIILSLSSHDILTALHVQLVQLNELKKITLLSCIGVNILAIASLAGLVTACFPNISRADQILPVGTFDLLDPSTGQSLTLTIKAAPSITFSAVQSLQCGISGPGAAVATATLNNGGPVISWVLTGDTTDFAIALAANGTGVITVGPNGITTVCPAGGSPTITATANW